MNQIIKTSSALLSCLALTSCSLFSSGTQRVTIETSDPNAIIKVNGATMGKGSVIAPLKKNKSHSIIAISGNKRGVAVIDSEMSTTGMLDIVGGVLFLVPFLGFCSKGAWELDPEHVHIDLQ